MTAVEFLTDKGYIMYPKIVEWPYIKNNTWQQTIRNDRVCENNNKLFINVRETQFEDWNENYSIEIVAEFNGLLWTLNSYSLTSKDLMDRHDEIVETLVKLFNTI